jgi:hypothetical protein
LSNAAIVKEAVTQSQQKAAKGKIPVAAVALHFNPGLRLPLFKQLSCF